MKRSIHILPLLLCSNLGWSQALTPAAPSNSAAPAGGLRVRGPEAVAQQDPNRVVATIAGKPITAKQALDLLKPLSAQDRKPYENNLAGLLQQLYMEGQIADEAAKMNLDQQSPWKEQLKLARENILTRAYIDKTSGGTGGAPPDPKQYYDAHAADFDQVKISGIQIAFSPPGTPASNANTSRTEAQAEEKATEVEKKIKGGADLSTLARTESDNQQSAAQGGALGGFVVSDPRVPADIKAAVAKLQPGQVSEPIHMNGSFYILKLDSRSKLPFDQVRSEIVQKLQNERTQTVLNQEKDKYKVQVQDPDFFNASSGPAPKIPSLARPSSGGTPSSTGSAKPPAK